MCKIAESVAKCYKHIFTYIYLFVEITVQTLSLKPGPYSHMSKPHVAFFLLLSFVGVACLEISLSCLAEMNCVLMLCDLLV